VPPSHVFYQAAALVAAADVMGVDGNGRFNPTEPATGADLQRAVQRLAELSAR
jgi:hypothetical protein